MAARRYEISLGVLKTFSDRQFAQRRGEIYFFNTRYFNHWCLYSLYIYLKVFYFQHFQIKTFGLKLLEGDQFFNGYDKTVDAQMSTAFAVAGYRFGHSLVQELFNRFSQAGFEHKCDKGKSKFLPIPVLDFNNPQYLYDTGKGGIDSILRGLVKDPAGKADG